MTETPSVSSRRVSLGLLGTALLSLGAEQVANAAPTTSSKPTKKPTKKPAGSTLAVTTPLASGLATSTSMDEHVARRLSLAATPSLFTEVRSKGWKTWVTEQLALDATAEAPMEKVMTGLLPQATMSHAEATAWAQAQGLSWGGVDQGAVNFARRGLGVVRSLMTPRHVNEALTQFWLDYFSVPYGTKGATTICDLDIAMRKAAATSFPAILKEMYSQLKIYFELDNNLNVKGKVNENLARETLELYTVGVGNFTETDMEQLAILLTGWGGHPYWGPTANIVSEHVFTSAPLVIMGRSYPNATRDEAVASWWRFIADMGMAPATARRVSLKLCQRFVADEPPATLVTKVYQTYMTTNGDVKKMLWAILNSSEFMASAGQKWKRPIEYMGAAHRGQEPVWVGTQGLRDHSWYYWYTYNPMESYRSVLALAGNEPRMWVPPNGYPDYASYWQGSSALLYPLNRVITGVGADVELSPTKTWVEVLGVSDTGQVSDTAKKLVRNLTGFAAPPEIVTAVTADLSNPALDFPTRVKNAVRTTLSSPLAWLR